MSQWLLGLGVELQHLLRILQVLLTDYPKEIGPKNEAERSDMRQQTLSNDVHSTKACCLHLGTLANAGHHRNHRTCSLQYAVLQIVETCYELGAWDHELL